MNDEALEDLAKKGKEALAVMKDTIEAEINELGVYIIVVAEVDAEEVFGSSASISNVVFEKLSDGVLHTIGLAKKGLPEMIFLLGPMPGERPMHCSEMKMMIRELSHLLTDFAQRTSAGPIAVGEMAPTANRTFLASDYENKGAGKLKQYMPIVSEFYQNTDYEVVLFKPIFRDTESIFKASLSKKVH